MDEKERKPEDCRLGSDLAPPPQTVVLPPAFPSDLPVSANPLSLNFNYLLDRTATAPGQPSYTPQEQLQPTILPSSQFTSLH